MSQDSDRGRSCERKRAYETEAEAKSNGMGVYHCIYCGKWHRTSGTLGHPRKLYSPADRWRLHRKARRRR
jgi:hypothetical protein